MTQTRLWELPRWAQGVSNAEESIAPAALKSAFWIRRLHMMCECMRSAERLCVRLQKSTAGSAEAACHTSVHLSLQDSLAGDRLLGQEVGPDQAHAGAGACSSGQAGSGGRRRPQRGRQLWRCAAQLWCRAGAANSAGGPARALRCQVLELASYRALFGVMSASLLILTHRAAQQSQPPLMTSSAAR